MISERPLQPPPGRLFILSAPSGAGKTSLVAALLQNAPDVALSISHTTRAPRPGEESGKHYFFVDEPTFQQLVERGEMLEHARVFEHWYGTSRNTVMAQLAAGRDVILEIDWQGARQVRAAFPDTLSIFILPPSRAELERRLRGRGQDNAEVIARRLRDAEADSAHYVEYDFTLINADFDRTLQDLHSLFRTQRLRTSVQAHVHHDGIASLLALPAASA
jgi:guanylate kinase